MYHLIYTSAPRLLEAGKTGFGTLARSKEMPQPLVAYIERLSTFDRAAGINTLVFYSMFRQGSLKYHVFSRVAEAGADYTGRTNHLAEHFAVEAGSTEERALAASTPAAVLLALESMWHQAYKEQPSYLPNPAAPAAAATAPSGAWAELAGRADCARWLCHPDYRSGAILRFAEIVPLTRFLQAMHDAMLHLPGHGWGTGFASATVSNLSIQAFPFMGLDSRQQAFGISCPPGCAVLDIKPGMPLPPQDAPKPLPQAHSPAPAPAAPLPQVQRPGSAVPAAPTPGAANAPGSPPPLTRPDGPPLAEGELSYFSRPSQKQAPPPIESKSPVPVPLIAGCVLAAGALGIFMFTGKDAPPATPEQQPTAQPTGQQPPKVKPEAPKEAPAKPADTGTPEAPRETPDKPAGTGTPEPPRETPDKPAATGTPEAPKETPDKPAATGTPEAPRETPDKPAGTGTPEAPKETPDKPAGTGTPEPPKETPDKPAGTGKSGENAAANPTKREDTMTKPTSTPVQNPSANDNSKPGTAQTPIEFDDTPVVIKLQAVNCPENMRKFEYDPKTEKFSGRFTYEFKFSHITGLDKWKRQFRDIKLSGEELFTAGKERSTPFRIIFKVEYEDKKMLEIIDNVRRQEIIRKNLNDFQFHAIKSYAIKDHEASEAEKKELSHLLEKTIPEELDKLNDASLKNCKSEIEKKVKKMQSTPRNKKTYYAKENLQAFKSIAKNLEDYNNIGDTDTKARTELIKKDMPFIKNKKYDITIRVKEKPTSEYMPLNLEYIIDQSVTPSKKK